MPIPQSIQQEISNGTPLPSGYLNHPYYRKLVKTDIGCSGVLIRNDWVLTAAHCVTAGGSASVFTPDGRRFYSHPGSIAVHPSLDLALIHLRDRVPYKCSTSEIETKESCHKVNLYLYSNESLVGKEVKCFGYGMSTLDPSSVGTLLSATLKIANLAGTAFEFHRNGLGQIHTPGDSGGPCFYYDQLVSITTIGYGRKNPDGSIAEFLGSYAEGVASFRDWVFETIKEAVPRLGVESDGISWVGVYTLTPEALFEQRIWNGKWTLTTQSGGPFGGPHPEVRWNWTRWALEMFYPNSLAPEIVQGAFGASSTNPVPTLYNYAYGGIMPGYTTKTARPISGIAAAALSKTDRTYMFYQTDQGEMGMVDRSDKTGIWGTPHSIGGSALNRFTSQPAVAVDSTGNTLHLFARGNLGEIRYNYFDGVIWNGWTSGFGGYITSAPGAASVDGKVVFAARGGDAYGIWYTKYTPGTAVGYGWKEIPGTAGATSGPGVTVFDNRVHIYYLNQKGEVCQVHERTMNKEDWQGPFCPIM